MTWVKLDDHFPRHPKIVGLDIRAKWAFIEVLCYCAEYLTDGRVPAGVISDKDAEPLLSNGLLEPDPHGTYLVHDYLEYNPPRAEVEGSRDAARERMRLVRTNNQPNVLPNVRAKVRKKFAESSDNPVPVPQPVPQEQKAFDQFWAIYPRKVGKRVALNAFARAVSRASPTAIVDGAQRLAEDPNLPESRFIPHPTTWLNRDGWDDDPLPPLNGHKPTKHASIRALADKLEAQGL